MARIRNNIASLYHCGRLTLYPGVNEVSDAALEKALTHPGFQSRIAAGRLQVLPSLEAVEDPRAAVLRDIAEMADIKQLKTLARGKDEELAAAAAERLDAIKAQGKPKAEEATEGE